MNATFTWKRMTSTPVTTERSIQFYCVEDGRECWRMVRWNSGRVTISGHGYAEPELHTKTVYQTEF